jgi:filamentous hemagglutinin
MVNTIVKQVKQRDCHLPGCLKQEIVIDFRGQSVSMETKNKIKNSIIEKSGGILGKNQIRFIGGEI